MFNIQSYRPSQKFVEGIEGITCKFVKVTYTVDNYVVVVVVVFDDDDDDDDDDGGGGGGCGGGGGGGDTYIHTYSSSSFVLVLPSLPLLLLPLPTVTKQFLELSGGS